MKKENILITVLIIINLVCIGLLSKIYIFEKSDKNNQDKNKLEDPQKMELFLQNELGYSSEQAKQFIYLSLKSYSQTNKLQDSIFKIKKEIVNNALGKNTNDSELIACSQKIGAIQTSIEQEMYRFFLDLKKISTEEQLYKFRILTINELFKSKHNIKDSTYNK